MSEVARSLIHRSVEAVSSTLNDVLPFTMDNDPVEQPDSATSGINTVLVWRSSRISRPPTRLIEESDI